LALDVDFEHDRFLYRLSAFKIQAQRDLLSKHHFDASIEGMRAMEMAVAAHMVDSPSVGERSKRLYLLIMDNIL